MQNELFEPITLEMKDAAEQQIVEHHKIIDYDTRDIPRKSLSPNILSGWRMTTMIFSFPTISAISLGRKSTNPASLNPF